MADGSFLAMTSAGTTPQRFYLYVDANGSAGPNLEGQDRIVVRYFLEDRVDKPTGLHRQDGSSADALNSPLYDALWQ